MDWPLTGAEPEWGGEPVRWTGEQRVHVGPEDRHHNPDQRWRAEWGQSVTELQPSKREERTPQTIMTAGETRKMMSVFSLPIPA